MEEPFTYKVGDRVTHYDMDPPVIGSIIENVRKGDKYPQDCDSDEERQEPWCVIQWDDQDEGDHGWEHQDWLILMKSDQIS